MRHSFKNRAKFAPLICEWLDSLEKTDCATDLRIAPYFLAMRIKAAPRFELGMRILQTLALPLGHAADRET